MFSQLVSSFAETNDPEAIKTRAKEDAKRDVSKLRWFGSGVGLVGLGVCCGGLGVVASELSSSNGDSNGLLFSPFYLIPLGGWLAIYRHSPSPPAEELIGKSPLYVSIYTDTYQSEARSIRTKMATSGICLIYGAAGAWGLYMASIYGW